MRSSIKKFIAAASLAGALGIGGAAVASAAQVEPDTTTVTAVPDDGSTGTVETPATGATTDTAATDDANCPGMDGSGPGRHAPAETPAPTDTGTADTAADGSSV
jgi:hypothetical protein